MMRCMLLTFAVFTLLTTDSVAQAFRGVVRDAGTGRPVAGAEIRVLPDGFRSTSGADGGFVVAAPPKWPATLLVTHDGYEVLRLALPSLAEPSL